MSTKHVVTPLLFSILAGVLTACSFAPLHLPALALLGVLIMICVWRETSAKQSFWYGLYFGVGLFATGVSWVEISIHNFGGTSFLLGCLITALFVLYLSLFPALLGYSFSQLRKMRRPALNYLIILPSLWVLFDYLRGTVFTGFPWLYVGYSFIDSPLRGWAPLLGVWGLSWISISSVGALYLFIYQRNRLTVLRSLGYSCLLLLFWLGGFYLNTIQWTQPLDDPQSIAMIQGNIPIEKKWSITNIKNSLNLYLTETEKLAAKHHIVIWPEAAMPIDQKRAKAFLQSLNGFGMLSDTAVVTGLLWSQGIDEQVSNAMIALGKNSQGNYLKRHLVPFGEYEPAPFLMGPIFNALSIPMSNFHPGPANPAPLKVAGKPVAAFICYEIAFPNLVAYSAKQAAWMLTISDDSWFGHSWAGAQQLQMAQMRSLETGRPMAYATSNGITALIDHKGYLVKRIPDHQKAILSSVIQPRSGLTPLLQYGPFSVVFIFALLLLFTGLKNDP